MSEYQYYEFLAIDRPLSAEEMSELSAISSRAEITQTRFCNVYNWGDLRGSPQKMMEKYFDAHVYITNWGTYQFMLRFPRGVIAEETLDQYVLRDALTFSATPDHLIVSWQRNDEHGGEWVNGEGWMAQLAPIREEIERGDHRALYIGWLAGAEYSLTGDEEDDVEEVEAAEPAVPHGLGSLTTAQQALAKLLDIGEDLLEVASLASSALSVEDTHRQMAEWTAIVPESEAREYLLAVLRGESRNAERQIRGRYHEFIRLHATGQGVDGPKRRTISEIRALVREARKEREKQEALERERKKIERERKRREYLKEMARRFPHWWKQAEAYAEEQKASSYDLARNILVDLRDAYAEEGRQKEFATTLQSFASKYARRPALIRRLKDAGMKAP
ncbi:MAG: hypothetical protein PHS17_06620 [Desulfobacterales bacterium]|nr:hypothetical protein [Desulfobacterales bacterium]